MNQCLKTKLKVAYSHVHSWTHSEPRNKSVTVLLAHEVSDLESFVKLAGNLQKIQPFISPDDFEKTFGVENKSPGPSWLMTFDDGYRSSATAIKALEERLGIHSAFFIVPKWVGLRGLASDEFIRHSLLISRPSSEEPVAWEDLRELNRRGHRIGCHSLSHLRLSSIQQPNELEKQISDSKLQMEQELRSSVNWFAFPFGDIDSINSEALNLIKKNYRFCFSGVRGGIDLRSSPWAVFRQSLAIDQSPALSVAEAMGAFDSFYGSARARLEEIAGHVR